MKNKVSAAKVQPTVKPSLAEMLKQKAQSSNSFRVSIPVNYLLEFDPENPDCETVLIFGTPRKVMRWNVQIDGKSAIAVFQVGQIARLYQAIIEESLPEGVSLSDAEQAVVVLTDKFATDRRNQKVANGSAGFLNLTPFTVKNSAAVETVSGFQFAE